MLAALVSAWLMVGRSEPQPAPPASVDQVMIAYRLNMAAIQSQQAAAGPPRSTAEAIARLRRLDVAVQVALGDLMRVHPSSAEENKARAEMRLVTRADDESLKGLLPENGWFTAKTDGHDAVLDAFMLVQHAPDLPFQEAMLPRIEQSVHAGDLSGESYGLLYDRVQVRNGRLQRYGSQTSCQNGRLAFAPMENEAQVDERRRAIGFSQTLAEYGRFLGVLGQPCDDELAKPS